MRAPNSPSRSSRSNVCIGRRSIVMLPPSPSVGADDSPCLENISSKKLNVDFTEPALPADPTPTCPGDETDGRSSSPWRLLQFPCSRLVIISKPSGETIVKMFAVFGLLISSVGNSIFFKKMTDSMQNYSWFVSQFTTFVYLPVFGVVVTIAFCNGSIDEEMTSFPKSRFAVMGFLDAAAGILTVVGGAFTAGSTQVVLQQSMIPATLLLTWLLIGAKYNALQYWGSLVIILGVLVVKLPVLMNPSHNDVLTFNMIFLTATIPNVLSQVYKEVAFRDAELDVNYMQFWVAIYQFGFGCLLVPFNTLNFLGSQKILFSEITSMVAAGSKCLFLGVNTIVNDCGAIDERRCDDCATAWIPMTTYVAFNLAYNCFTLLVVKQGGATLSFLIATLRMPLSSMAFYSKTIMGPDATEPKITDAAGLAVLLSGLGVYRYGGLLQRRKEATASPRGTLKLPFFATFIEPEPLFVRVQRVRRSPDQIRSSYYWKLAVASPHQSPFMREKAALHGRGLDQKLIDEAGGFLDAYLKMEDLMILDLEKNTPGPPGEIRRAQLASSRADSSSTGSLMNLNPVLGSTPVPSAYGRSAAVITSTGNSVAVSDIRDASTTTSQSDSMDNKAPVQQRVQTLVEPLLQVSEKRD
eukprot:Lankesteria_metandrocarpae@DN2090_c0_g1_i1.p1